MSLPRAALVYWLHCTPAIPKVLWANTEAVTASSHAPAQATLRTCFMVPVTPDRCPTNGCIVTGNRGHRKCRRLATRIVAALMPHQGRRQPRKASLVDLKQDTQRVVFHHSLALIVFRRKCPGPNQLPRGRIDGGPPGNRTVLFCVSQPANGVHQAKKITAGKLFVRPTQQLGGVWAPRDRRAHAGRLRVS